MTRPTPPPSRAVPLVVPPADQAVAPLPDAHPAVYPTNTNVEPATTTYADLPVAPAAYAAPREPTPRRRHRAPLAWLPWALLAGIVALCLLAWLASSLADNSGTSATPSTAGRATLTASGDDLLASTGALRSHAGQPAVGHAVLVQSVVSDEGFWVGSSAADRVFIHLGAASRSGQAESPFQVRAGQHIDLTGTVQRLGEQAFGVTTAEGLAQLRTEAAFVEATTVRLSS